MFCYFRETFGKRLKRRHFSDWLNTGSQACPIKEGFVICAAIPHVGHMKCLCCEDTGWVCEVHQDQPWTGPHACTCGGAGMPCPTCNPSSKDDAPRLPRGLSLMANKGWTKRFDEPIVLDDGTTLTTLQQAVAYLAKTVPKAEQNHETVLIAADHLTRSAEQNYPMFFARAAAIQAINGTASASSIPIAKTIIGENGS